MNFSKKFLRAVSLALMFLILIPTMPAFADSFKDVKSTHWAYDYIERMAKLKIINGYEDNTFLPKGTLTYLETIQLLSKLLNLSEEELRLSKQNHNKLMGELNIPVWAQDAVIKCIYKGVISEADLRSASSKDLLRVGTNKRVGRLDISIFMAKAMGLEGEANKKPFVSLTYKDLLSIKSEYHKLIYILVEAGVLDPKGTGNGYFEPSSPLLREQMAKMLATAYDYLQKNPSTPTVPEEETETISGLLTKITTLGSNTFLTVKNRFNIEAAYLVDSNTSIKLDSKAVTVTSLYEGQDIKIIIKKGINTALSVEAESAEEKIVGVLNSISPSYNKLTVEFTKDQTTISRELSVDEDADIILDGNNADLYDLNKGDEVTLYTKNNVVLEIEATAKSGKLQGEIVDLQTKRTSGKTIYYISIQNSKMEDTEYELDEDVYISRNNSKASFEDLRKGDAVELELEYGLVIDIDADVVEKDVEGFITAISTRLNMGVEITIKNKATDKEETYALGRNVKIKVDNSTANSFDLNVGYYVEAVIEGNEIVEIYADSAGSESMVRGKITYISSRNNRFEVEVISSDIEAYKYGDEIEISTSSDVVIAEGSYYNLKLSDLIRGMNVYIFGYYDGYRFVANEINIR